MTIVDQLLEQPAATQRETTVRPAQSPLSGQRIKSVDALRGLAALSVVFGHALLFFREPLRPEFHALASGDWHRLSPIFLIEISPLHLMVAGHEAVMLFFLLSGFVLFLPWEEPGTLTYRTYLIRRICRIYLPYLAALLPAIVLNFSLSTGGLPGMNEFFNRFWKLPVQIHDVLVHVCMLGGFNTDAFVPPIWSLVHEMRLSLVFPLLAGLVRRDGKPLAIVGMLSIAGLITDYFWGGREENYFISLHYAALFLLGAWLAGHRRKVEAWYNTLSPRYRGWLLAGSVLVYIYGRFLSSLWPGQPAFPDIFIAAGAVGILVWALSNPPLLQAAPAQWLGRISYGLYLVHFSVYLSLVYLLHRFLPAWTIIAIAIPVALALSHGFWRFVECPSIRLGRALTR